MRKISSTTGRRSTFKMSKISSTTERRSSDLLDPRRRQNKPESQECTGEKRKHTEIKREKKRANATGKDKRATAQEGRLRFEPWTS
jgi:hypothetical protein